MLSDDIDLIEDLEDDPYFPRTRRRTVALHPNLIGRKELADNDPGINLENLIEPFDGLTERDEVEWVNSVPKDCEIWRFSTCMT